MPRVFKRKLKNPRPPKTKKNPPAKEKSDSQGSTSSSSLVGKWIVFVGFAFCGLLLSKYFVTTNPLQQLANYKNNNNGTVASTTSSSTNNSSSNAATQRTQNPSATSPSATKDTSSSSSFPSDTCWSNLAFDGRPWDWNHTSTWEMTPQQCLATQTFWGGSGMDFQKAHQHLHNGCKNGRGGGLKILVVGGSITTGHSKSFDPRILADYEKAWPAQLEKYLNTHYPCGGNNNATLVQRHEVINRSERSVASDHWMGYFLQARQDPDHPVNQADIILLETASNDFQNWHLPNELYQTIKYVELIVRILRQLSHKPIIMWITVGWRDTFKFKDKPIASCSEAQHLVVMKHYDIPHISMLQAYYHQPSLAAHYDFLTQYYFADITSHLTILGHQLTGGVVGTRLSKQLASTQYPPSADLYSLPPSLITQYKPDDIHWQNMLQIIDNSNSDQQQQIITTINFRSPDHPIINNGGGGDDVTTTKDSIVYNQGWKFEEDVEGKPGLIAYDIGAKLVVNIPTLTHNHQWMFTLGVLKSYEHMGAINVRFWYLYAPTSEESPNDYHHHHLDDEEPAREDEKNFVHDNRRFLDCLKSHWDTSPQYQKTFMSKTIDTLWDTKASVKDVENMVVMKAYVNDAPKDGHICAWMEIVVRHMRPARSENKIKLLDLTIL